jgi:hypothetical protein
MFIQRPGKFIQLSRREVPFYDVPYRKVSWLSAVAKYFIITRANRLTNGAFERQHFTSGPLTILVRARLD